MLSEVAMNPKENREKMAQIIFETFNIHGLYIEIQPVLSLYSVGKLNGLVADSGEGITQIVPVFDGFSLPHAINKIDLAGKDITNYILEKVIQRNSNSLRKKHSEIIKEKACYVALDLEEELKSVEGYPYKLPDGREIYIKDQRIICPEAMFKPSIIGKEGIGI
jgi:actin-related protein